MKAHRSIYAALKMLKYPYKTQHTLVLLCRITYLFLNKEDKKYRVTKFLLLNKTKTQSQRKLNLTHNFRLYHVVDL
jgi:hypothetical protein